MYYYLPLNLSNMYSLDNIYNPEYFCERCANYVSEISNDSSLTICKDCEGDSKNNDLVALYI